MCIQISAFLILLFSFHRGSLSRSVIDLSSRSLARPGPVMAVNALDLPQVWQKPCAADLLESLQQLRVDPPVWNLKISRAEILKEQDTTVHHRREIAAYLSSIIKSELSWIDDDEDREAIWTEASKRFSERCGRSGESLFLWLCCGSVAEFWASYGRDHSPMAL